MVESRGQPHPPLGLMEQFSMFRKQHCPNPTYWLFTGQSEKQGTLGGEGSCPPPPRK